MRSAAEESGHQDYKFSSTFVKGSLSTMKGNKENAIGKKQKNRVLKGDACSFRHDESKRGKVTQSSSLAPRPQTQNDGNFFEREPPRGAGFVERDFKDRAEITFMESLRLGINSVKSASSCTQMLT